MPRASVLSGSGLVSLPSGGEKGRHEGEINVTQE